jgi:MATE family multidrug resistance protein
MAPRSIEPDGSRSSRLSSLNSRASEAEDLALRSDMDEEGGYTGEDGSSQSSTLAFSSSVPPNNPHSLASSYRRPSFFTTGPRGTVIPHEQHQEALSEQEREQAIEEERSFLRDNNVIPPDNRRGKSPGLSKKISGLLSKSLRGTTSNGSEAMDSDVADEESAISPDNERPDYATDITERTTLLGIPTPSDEEIDQKWEEAVAAGLIQTTWRREARVLSGYSFPLMLAFLLQYSLTVASIFTVGHLGKVELGAVSLASMTASITGYAVYQGLATSLDTLCAQAYGSGKKQLVGLQMQRMVYFLWVMTIPIGIIWLLADKILMKIVPEKDVAILAGRYLKVVLLGAPGLACFESAKRYVQAQGLFSASLYVLLICAPLNAFMNWLFVWVSRSPP